MKLYKILFEQKQLKLLSPEEMQAPKSAFAHIPTVGTSNDYSAPTFAMFDWLDGSEQGFALIHAERFKQWVEGKMTGPFERWLCAYAGSTERHSSDCGGAVEISYMVRSPQFPGAGGAMYALVSNYYNAPITSDRKNSTSNSAKKAWAKIESGSDWTKVDLDNWKTHFSDATGKAYKKWFNFKGTWPNRSVKSTDEEGLPEEVGPITPDNEQDDCAVPKAKNDDDVNKKLGTANAWIYSGPLNAEELLSHCADVLSDLVDYTKYARSEIENEIKKKSNKMFLKYYKGVEG